MRKEFECSRSWNKHRPHRDSSWTLIGDGPMPAVRSQSKTLATNYCTVVVDTAVNWLCSCRPTESWRNYGTVDRKRWSPETSKLCAYTVCPDLRSPCSNRQLLGNNSRLLGFGFAWPPVSRQNVTSSHCICYKSTVWHKRIIHTNSRIFNTTKRQISNILGLIDIFTSGCYMGVVTTP